MLLEMTSYAALIGLFAVVYRHILAYEEILNWWFRFGSRYEGRWFWKPIWGCELCIAGQIAFWTYTLNWLMYSYFDRFPSTAALLLKSIPLYSKQDFNVLNCFIFTCEAIAFAFVIYKGFKKLKD